MSWTIVIWSMTAGICLAMAGVHLLVWLRNRDSQTNLAFAFSAIGAAATGIFELALMQSQTTAQYGQILRWLHVPLFVLAVSYVWFVGAYLQAGRAWLLWSFLTVRALVLIIDLMSSPNISFQEITSLHIISIWGDTFAVPAGIMSPWAYLIRLGDVLLLLFIGDASYAAWKKGKRRQGLITGAVFFVAAAIAVTLSVMLVKGKLPVPLTISMPFLLITLVMGVDMSLDLLRVQRISRELSKNQERIRLAAKAVNLGIWEWDVAKNNIWATEVGRVRVGVRDNEKISIDRFLQSVHPDDCERVRKDVQRAIEGSGEPAAEYRVIAEDGETRWVSSRGMAERDTNGRVVRVHGVTVDITEMKRTEEALEESLARYRAIVEFFDGFIYICSADYRIEFMNQRLIERTGRNAVGEFCYHVLHDKDSVCEWCVNERVFKGETMRWEVQSPKDNRWYDVVNTPIRHADGTLSKQAMIQDITDRKQAETERIQLRLELAHLNRVLTMSELSSSLAHEINQPLGAILNNASAAKILHTQSTGGVSGEVGEILDDIIADTNRASQIVRQIRGIIKKESVLFESLDMNTMIGEVVELFRNPLSRERISVREELSPDLLRVRGDRIRLQQVVMNLIMNATDAMKGSSTKIMMIRTANQGPDTVIVSISDTGPGINEETKDKLFDPFYTTKKDGLGMGLRICRSIVEEHGGRIWSENSLDGGATFSFSLNTRQGGT